MPLTGQDFMHPSPQRHSVLGQSAKVQAPVGRLSGHQFQTVAGYVRLFQPAVPMPIAGCPIPVSLKYAGAVQAAPMGPHPQRIYVSGPALINDN